MLSCWETEGDPPLLLLPALDINTNSLLYSIKDINYNKTYDYRKAMGFEISEKEAFDIDTEFEFTICELMHKSLGPQ